MKLNGLKEEHYFHETTPKDSKMWLEFLFWNHEKFAGLRFLDLENETFSQHHFHNKFRAIFNFKRFPENLVNDTIHLFKNKSASAFL